MTMQLSNFIIVSQAVVMCALICTLIWVNDLILQGLDLKNLSQDLNYGVH